MTGQPKLGFGWIVTSDLSRLRYVLIDGNGDWSWVREARNAALFRTRESAQRWIIRNLAGGAPRVVEHNW